MFIKSITVQNVRRFINPVTIDHIESGLNVLSAPNESGKSTFFDALQAVFFENHRSWSKYARSLAPNIGGDPEITVCFDLDNVSWKLSKQWSSSPGRKQAGLEKNGILVAQGEQAEDLLAEMIAAPKNGGPAALLWVRQGLVEMSGDIEEHTACQDIMKLVAGEVETITVGRRMDRAIKACNEALKENLTSTGKEKTGGPLKTAGETIAEITHLRDDAQNRVTASMDDLQQRRTVKARLAEFRDVRENEARSAQLKEAEQRLSEAEQQNADVQLAQGRVDTLEARETGAREKTVRLRLNIEKLAKARETVNATAEQLKKTQAAFDPAQNDRETARMDRNRARVAHEKATQVLQHVMRAEASAGSAARRAELTGRITKAETLQEMIETIRRKIRQEITTKALHRIETLSTDLSIAEQARKALAPVFRITYEGSDRISYHGNQIAGDRDFPFTKSIDLSIPGIGIITITPGEQPESGDIDAARIALKQALQHSGYSTIEEARESAQTGMALEEELRTHEAEFKAIAPKDIGNLRAELAELPETIEINEELPSRNDAEQAEARTRENLHATNMKLDSAEKTFETLRDDLATRQGKAASNEALLQSAQAALKDTSDPNAEIANQEQLLQGLVQELGKARNDLATLQETVTDLDIARATVKRARDVIENNRISREKLERDLAGLNARIQLSSSGAPEEELALLQGQLEFAEARLAEIQFDVNVNLRLKAALERARKAALETHVKPVTDELQPLLRILWPDAEPEINAENGSLSRITRSNVEEDLEFLSGGTREQISLMVRLAFANILAKQGRPAPIILDDAIVYTDDDRIEQMFNALTRQSTHLQIIVLSCRQRAFRELGGTLLSINQVDRTG